MHQAEHQLGRQVMVCWVTTAYQGGVGRAAMMVVLEP